MLTGNANIYILLIVSLYRWSWRRTEISN